MQRNRALQEAEARVRRANTELEMLYDLERQISEANDPRVAGARHPRARVLAAQDGERGDPARRRRRRAGVRRRGARRFGRARSRSIRAARARCSAAPSYRRYRVADATGALADVIVPDALGLRLRETFTAPLSDARSTIGMLQLANRLDEGASEDWVLRMVSLLAGQVTRGIVVKREREAGERAERLAMLGHSVGAICTTCARR